MSTSNNTYSKTELDAVREPLSKLRGAEYWRSLEELSKTEVFQDYVHNEFPAQASAPASSLTRRNFLQVMGSSLALAGLTTGCARQPAEMIVPYIKPPEDLIPGEPLYYASASVEGGYAEGVLVETHMGRPTKIEGLPEHPASLGATSIRSQASVLNLYDPDRSGAIIRRGVPSDWQSFIAEIRDALAGAEDVRVLTGTVTSPSLASQLAAFGATYPNARWHQFEAGGRDNVRAGSKLAFGEYVDTLYHFDKADVVLSLDGDFLGTGPAQVRHSKDFAHRRDVVDHHEGDHDSHSTLNRLYVFESTPSITGAAADHRFAVRATHIESIARAIAAGVGASVSGNTELGELEQTRVAAIVKDLKAHAGHGIVVAGEHQPAVVHALAHAINQALENVGETVEHVASAEAEPVDQGESLASLVKDMAAGNVDVLIMLGGNPVYDAPLFAGEGEDAQTFLAAMQNVDVRVHHSLYDDETSEFCHWHVPELHALETWGDARAFDGSVSLIQPMVAPFYEGKTATELLSALHEETARTAHEVVMQYWESERPGESFTNFWAEALSRGTVEGTASTAKAVSVSSAIPASAAAPTDGFEIVMIPDPSIGNGQHANNAWLQEVPKSLTKITWDNAVIMSAASAADVGVKNEDLVQVEYKGRTLQGPAWIQPGHATGVITLHLGFGRTRCGQVGTDQGFNVYAIQTADAPSISTGATVTKLTGKSMLATTEEHYNIEWAETAERRGLIREFTQKEYDADSEIVHHVVHEMGADYTLFDPDEKKWDGNKWGMTIDLNKCTGCNACIVACQSENNIPVVGKWEVHKGREMQWIRVDRYYRGSIDDPKANFQPVPCMQCENAPCEVVCPVGATQHTKEGLNDMVYNRCIGTRYCSNNCPYKVRRFNFYNYSRTPLGQNGDAVFPAYHLKKDGGSIYPETIKPMRNPDVTIRTRGVMEKCTYCVQRLNLARIDAKKKGLEQVPDGAVTTACEQSCPSSAISFGNLHAEGSKVAELKESHRNYATLGDINTQPRTTYLARLTNPNEELEA